MEKQSQEEAQPSFTATPPFAVLLASEVVVGVVAVVVVWLSKEVWKLNFRQYGQMEKHSQEEAQPRRK